MEEREAGMEVAGKGFSDPFSISFLRYVLHGNRTLTLVFHSLVIYLEVIFHPFQELSLKKSILILPFSFVMLYLMYQQ